MGETDAPEQRRSEEALPPESVPAVHYAIPLHARLLHAWLDNPQIPSIQDALLPLLDTMTPSELLTFGQHIDGTYIQGSHDPAVSPLWAAPTERTVDDETGLVTAAFGHIDQVTQYFKDEAKAGPVLDYLQEDLLEETFFAAERWRGAVFAANYMDAIAAEEDRRIEKHVAEQEPASPLEAAS
jgi:hypothetical protein